MRRVESGEGVRLETERCTIEIERLRPGALLLVIRGDDAGELGDAPHAEIDREISRYGPAEVWIDARQTTGVGPAVADAWIRFIRARGGDSPDARGPGGGLRRVTLLVASRQVGLAAESAGALGGVGRAFRVGSDAVAFDAEVAGRRGVPGARPSAPIQRDVRGDEVVLSAGGLQAAVRGRGPSVVEVTLSGFDGGQLCAPLFDEIAGRLAGAPRWTVFVDARACSGVAGRAADAWSAWTRAHAESIAALHVLATSTAVRLALGLEGELGGLRRMMRVHTDPAEFARARDTAAR